jgi:hypothetical protein
MSKYNRHSSVVSRQSDESIGEDHWFKQFEKTLQKGAVQPKNPNSLFDQINSIMNGKGKSKHPSVEAAVKDMQERSGLTAYLDKISKTSEEEPTAKKVVASDNQSALDKKVQMTPIVIQKHPQILRTLENHVNDTRGNQTVPAIINKIRSIHQNDCSDAKDWDDDKLTILVSRLNLAAKKNNPDTFSNNSNLGRRDTGSDSEIDPSNTDAFFALTPAKL